ncbi:P-loop containing nucleoside triphosphate hydrolase protein [Cerioporus squamosus]|nr:P-loop containing nucleoside triphosphate hydrolase protein [Cerioporus squamosus]
MARTALRNLLRSRPPPPANQRRPRLTDEDLKNLACTMREKYLWTADPKPFQLAGVKAQLEGIDMIIQAATGAGKTAIAAGPHLWPGSEGKTTIMVSPLLSLEEEMVRTFKDKFGLEAVAVNSKNGACLSQVLQRIVAGMYHVVLISPEMLQLRVFLKRVLRNSRFSRRILSVIVDEAHCVSHWGADFRKKYGTLGIIRAFLPRGTPVIALSATITPRVRRDLMSKLHFPKGDGSNYLNVGNDRPNVSIVVRACEHPLSSYADLDFVIPSQATAPSDIPKTYIYADNIHVGTEIVEYLTTRIATRLSLASGTPDDIVRPFNANLSHQYHTEAMEKFRLRTVRILVCTDAAGMGCNVRDVDMVVQWKLPATLSNFIQCAGRAARAPDRSGIAVLLVEPSARARNKKRTAKDTTEEPPSQQQSPIPKHAAKAYAEAHGLRRGTRSGKHDEPPKATGVAASLNPDAADEGLLALVQSITCRRLVWTAVYETQHVAQHPTVSCCDICEPRLFDRVRPGEKPQTQKKKTIKHGEPAHAYRARLDTWRREMFTRDHTGAQFDHTAILSDSHIEHLISVGSINKVKLHAILGSSWVWWDEYGDKLAAYMMSPSSDGTLRSLHTEHLMIYLARMSHHRQLLLTPLLALDHGHDQ